MERLARRLDSQAVLQLGVKEGVQADAIHQALDRLFEASGCPRCGLNGFDLAIHVLDDDWSRQFGKILDVQRDIPQFEGVQSLAIIGG